MRLFLKAFGHTLLHQVLAPFSAFHKHSGWSCDCLFCASREQRWICRSSLSRLFHKCHKKTDCPQYADEDDRPKFFASLTFCHKTHIQTWLLHGWPRCVSWDKRRFRKLSCKFDIWTFYYEPYPCVSSYLTLVCLTDMYYWWWTFSLYQFRRSRETAGQRRPHLSHGGLRRIRHFTRLPHSKQIPSHRRHQLPQRNGLHESQRTDGATNAAAIQGVAGAAWGAREGRIAAAESRVL